MRLLSFNPYRSLGLPEVRYIKPEHLLRHRDEIQAADWVLFPETWQVVYVGEGIVTAYWRRGGDGFHHNIAAGAAADFAEVPEAAVALADRLARELGVNYAGFDIAMVGGHPYFLELNLFFGYAALQARDIRLAPVLLDYLERLSCPGHEPPRPAAVGFRAGTVAALLLGAAVGDEALPIPGGDAGGRRRSKRLCESRRRRRSPLAM